MKQDANGHTLVTLVDGTTFTGLTAADGSINVFDASAVSTPTGLHHPCGAMNVSVVDGTSFTGYHAANGAVNVINEPAVTGKQHPCGALNVSGLV